MLKTSGKLFIVATPIGNLSDITIRALDTLKQVDLIAAEDTRHSHKLLQHYNINTPMASLHNYNEISRSKFICNMLQEGKNIALVSDAGTPLISDPGYHLLKEVISRSFHIIPIPGPCALITALCASGLPTDRFVFEGFLPAKPNQQIKCLTDFAIETRTMIFYESKHRLLQTIGNMIKIFGADRYAVIAKELTKIFETIYGNTLGEIQKLLLADPKIQNGEFVILVKGREKSSEINPEVLRILNLLSENLSSKQAVALTSQITGVNKNKLYKINLSYG